MPIAHLLLTLLVVVVWGINFLFVKLALNEMTPFWLCVVRFLLASLPAMLWIKPPQMPLRVVALYGLVMFTMQFGFVFLGMHVGMPPGMTSIVMQVQVFFSMFFAAFYLKEIPYPWQIVGAFIAFLGIGLIAMHFDSNATLSGFLCILAAAASWGAGNLITKKYHHVNMMGLVIWGSFFASIPMLVLALLFEGPQQLIQNYHQTDTLGIISVLYITYGSTWLGYGTWNWLISRYPVSTMVPFTLLIPIVGVFSSAFWLGEPLQSWKMIAGALVIGGLSINIMGARFFTARTATEGA